MGISTASIRAAIQELLNANETMSAQEIEDALKDRGFDVDYHQVNRALNSGYNQALGETPFARTDGEDAARWVWYAVTKESPVTQRVFTFRTSTALTQMEKTRDLLLSPAIKMGAVAVGDDQALDESLDLIDASIKALSAARNAGDAKARASQLDAEAAAIVADRADLARREREFALKEKALIKSSASKKPLIKRK